MQPSKNSEHLSIALVVPFANPHVLSIFDELKGCANCTIDIYVYRDLPGHRKELGWRGASNVRFLKTNPIAFAKNVQRFTKYDHVFHHGFFDPFPAQTLLLSALAVRNVKLWILTEGFKRPRSRLPFPLRLMLNRSNLSVLAAGFGCADDFRRCGLTDLTYYRFCYNERYSQRAKSRVSTSADSDKLRLLGVGQLVPRKNFASLVDVLLGIQTDKVVELRICGDGPEREAISRLGARLPSNIEVCLLGNCNARQLDDEYSQADLFVMPSRYDGWGVVLNQAIEYGLPVVVSSGVRSARDNLVIEGKNGLIYDSDEQLAEFLCSVFSNPGHLDRLASGSRELAPLWRVDNVALRLDQTMRAGVHFDSGPMQLI